jgi:hypothetical protein
MMSQSNNYLLINNKYFPKRKKTVIDPKSRYDIVGWVWLGEESSVNVDFAFSCGIDRSRGILSFRRRGISESYFRTLLLPIHIIQSVCFAAVGVLTNGPF